jgi:hypothetical protein
LSHFSFFEKFNGATNDRWWQLGHSGTAQKVGIWHFRYSFFWRMQILRFHDLIEKIGIAKIGVYQNWSAKIRIAKIGIAKIGSNFSDPSQLGSQF